MWTWLRRKGSTGGISTPIRGTSVVFLVKLLCCVHFLCGFISREWRDFCNKQTNLPTVSFFKIKLNKCAWCDNENCGGGFIHCICDWLTAECCVAGSPGLTWIALAADTRTQHFIRNSFLVLDYTSFCLQICCKSLWQIQWGTGNSP